jgi:hypothetical protein
MTDQLNKSIEHLRTLSPKLNKATDLANAAVAVVEKFLNDECSLGIPARKTAWIKEGESTLDLAYERVNGKFRIAIIEEEWIPAEGHSPDFGEWRHVETRPWAESSRGDKLRTFAALPKLLDAIVTEVEAAIQKTDETVAAVEKIMGAMGKPSINLPIPTSNVAKGEMTTAKIEFSQPLPRATIRVSELAKEMGIPSKSILDRIKAEGLGDHAPNHMSLMSLGLAASVREWFAADSRSSEGEK